MQKQLHKSTERGDKRQRIRELQSLLIDVSHGHGANESAENNLNKEIVELCNLAIKGLR